MLKKTFLNFNFPLVVGDFIFLYLLIWLAALTSAREMVIQKIFQFFVDGWLKRHQVVIKISTRATHAMATALVKELVDHAQSRFGEWRPRLPDRKVGPRAC